MASAIDITKPVYGAPTTQSVRDNFSAASDEITTLQNETANRVRKDGDTMQGDLVLYQDPSLSMHATNRSWVLNQIHSTATAIIYIGDYDAATDQILTSGQSSIPINQPLPVATSGNANMYVTVKVGKAAPSIGNQPPGGVPVGSWLISNGTSWNVYQPAAAGVTAQSVPVNPEIAGLPGPNVYAALNSVPALFLPKTGGILTGDLTAPNFIINTAPTLANHATTKSYVDGLSSNVAISDTPPVNPKSGGLWWDSVAGQLNISYQDADSQQWVIANSSSGWVDAPSDGITYARRNTVWTSVNALVAPFNNNVGRNLLHNPLFNVAQRGAGLFTASGHTVDRWYHLTATDTFSSGQASLTDAQRAAIGDEAAKIAYSNTFTGNAAAGAFNMLLQRMEDVRRLASKTITVSFWATCGAGALKLGVSIDQVFGTGGSPSAYVLGNGTAVTLSTTFARYSVTLSVPTVSGKTLGTNGDDYTEVDFWFSSGATNATRSGNVGVQSGAIALWGIQLEIGSVMTPLEKPDPQQDLAKCQRFYQSGQAIFNQYSGSASIAVGQTISFNPMRSIPTIAYGAAVGVDTNLTIVSADVITERSFRFLGSTTGIGNVQGGRFYTASADL